MHISTTKIAFSLEEIFNYLRDKDPNVTRKVNDLICEYAEELYQNYPGTKLPLSPVTKGLKFKQCGVPIYFEIGATPISELESFRVDSRLDFS